MYKVNVKNKFLLLCSIFVSNATSDSKTNKVLSKKTTVPKTTTKKVLKPNITFKFNNTLLNSEEITQNLVNFLKDMSKVNMEMMFPFLLETMTEAIYKNIPEEQKASFNSTTIQQQKDQLKSLLENQLRSYMNQTTLDQNNIEELNKKINETLDSELNTEMIYLIKLSSMIIESNKNITDIFKKYQDIFNRKIAIEAEMSGKTLIAMTMANGNNPDSLQAIQEEIKNMSGDYENISNEMRAMMSNDIPVLFNILIKTIKEEIKNKDTYYLTFKGKKISLNQMLNDMENNKNNTEVLRFFESVFMLFLPKYINNKVK